MQPTDKMQRKLFIKPYDRMIKDLVNEIDNGTIILDPDYQRNYVWSNTKASLLVIHFVKHSYSSHLRLRRT